MKFTDYLLMREVADPEGKLEKTSSGYRYRFEIPAVNFAELEVDSYVVSFEQQPMQGESGKVLTDRALEIVFQGPSAISQQPSELGDQDPERKKNFLIIQGLFNGVREVLSVEQPEGLIWHAPDPRMSDMFNMIYRRHLRDSFVDIGSGNYLRKDIYESLPSEDR